MTPDQINVKIAEFVFGWRKIKGPSYDHDGPTKSHDILVPPTISDKQIENGFIWPQRGEVMPWYFCRKWSTDISDAWRVVEKMTERNDDRFYDALSIRPPLIGLKARDAAKTICLAALEALE